MTQDGRLDSSKPLLSLSDSFNAFMLGVKHLMQPIFIVIMAWTVGEAFVRCGTGSFISLLLRSKIDARAYPTLTFLASAALSGVTGTSWGTMSIMFPLVLPMVHSAAPCNRVIFYGTISSILSGSVFGDHCSPISDTTVLSAASCR